MHCEAASRRQPRHVLWRPTPPRADAHPLELHWPRAQHVRVAVSRRARASAASRRRPARQLAPVHGAWFPQLTPYSLCASPRASLRASDARAARRLCSMLTNNAGRGAYGPRTPRAPPLRTPYISHMPARSTSTHARRSHACALQTLTRARTRGRRRLSDPADRLPTFSPRAGPPRRRPPVPLFRASQHAQLAASSSKQRSAMSSLILI